MKKLLHFTLVATVLLYLLCVTICAADTTSVLGDMNGDAAVDINDAIYLLKHTMMPSRYPVSQPGDVNGTGEVNIDDAIYLLKHTMIPSRYPITIPGTYYTITWKNDDGTVLKTTLCEEDKTPSFGGETPTKECDSQYSYTFDRWATEIIPATEDATYVAIYSKIARATYTISYDANGGTGAPSSQSKSKGTAVNLSASIPINEGKPFIGWICANDGMVYKVGSLFNVDSDVTLYAVWGGSTTCYTCEGSGSVPTIADCSICSGTGKVSQTVPKRVDCYNCIEGSNNVSCDDCYGQGWTSRSYDCRYCYHRWHVVGKGGSRCPNCGSSNTHAWWTEICETCHGEGYNRVDCDSCSGLGYIFKSEIVKNDCSTCSGSGDVPSTMECTNCNGTKVLPDTSVSHMITLKDHNSTVGTTSVTVNNPYKLIVPTRSGYTFLGWFDAEENGTQYTDGEGVCLSVWSDSENKTLYARWSLNYYTITYDCDEEVDHTCMPTLYTVEDEDFALNRQYKNHQTVSWDWNNITIISVDTSIAKDITIKGIWISAARAPVIENVVEPTTCVDGHFDSVIYCEGCGEELSREKITIFALHNLEKGICTLCDYEYFSSNLKFTSNGDNTCYVSNIGGCTDTDIYIPRVSPTGEVVTRIGESAFNWRSGLSSITIPDSVTSIGSYAFSGCSSLTSITIPDSVMSIDGSAFSGCSGLAYNEYDNAYYLGNNNNPYVVLVKVKDQSITSCDINSNTKIIYACAFENSSSLASLTIPDSVTSIGSYAFSGCSSLTSITIPDSVMSIDGSAFSGCSGLAYNEYDNAYYLGNNNNPYVVLVKVKDQSITSCDINSNTKIIYACAFENSSSLASLTIPDSVTSIGGSAFSGCSSLTSITIPDSVMSIGNIAFSGCSSLTSITIPDSVMSIGSYAFSGCSSLTSITIPDSVTSIGSFAFDCCRSLISVTIPDSVTSIGSYAFDCCSSLTSITIPDSVMSIGSGAFADCSSLKSVTIGDGVTSIGSSAFFRCTSLISIKYTASKSQWQAITKGTGWNYYTGGYTITYNYTGE